MPDRGVVLMRLIAFAVVLGGIGGVLCMAGSARAQDGSTYPVKAVRIIVPSSPGGGTDTTARIVAPRLSELLGQTVVVENRAGAAAMLGGEFVARAPPDGYTLLVAPSTLVIVPSLYRKMRFDPIKDLAPIGKLIVIPQLLVSHPAVPAKTLKELMALARAKPGLLDYGAGAYGGNGHMSMALFLLMTGLDINYVPYKSGNAGIVETLSGEVPIMMGNLLTLMPHVRAGKLRAYGVTSARRVGGGAGMSGVAGTADLAAIPTIAEAGVPGYDSSQWFGMLAPAGTSGAVIARLHREVGRVLADATIRRRFQIDGGEADASASAEEFGAFMRADLTKWAKVVKAAGLKQQ